MDDRIDAMIMDVKQLRSNLYTYLEDLRRGIYGSGREIALATTELQSVRHWLGEHLAVLGAANPYVKTNDCSSTHVEPPADT